MRVIEGTINSLKHEIDDLKNLKGNKGKDDTFFRTVTQEGDGSMTPNIRSNIEEKFKTLKKKYNIEIDQCENDIKSLENQLALFKKEVTNKVDKGYIETLEASINNIVKQNNGNCL